MRFTGRTLEGKCLEITVHDGFIKRREPVPDNPDLPWLLPVLVGPAAERGAGNRVQSHPGQRGGGHPENCGLFEEAWNRQMPSIIQYK